jgi:thiaminase/transcriptional activator TenA
MSVIDEFIEHRLVSGCGELWEVATHADFLDAVGAGTLPELAFHRWLVQDYFFAKHALFLQAIAVARTPRPDNKPLIAGLVAFDAELDWFETNLARRGLRLDAPMHPVCRRYTDFFISASFTQPFEVLLAIIFGEEVTYLGGWSALEPKGQYADFIQRWSNPGFVAYVRSLADLCRKHPHPDAQDYFNETLRHERDFWRMTWEG